MSTTSTTNIYRTLRTRLLSFTPAAGATLASRLGNRLFVAQAPDDATYPYGVMTLSLSTEGAYNGDREQGIFEVTLYDRPRSRQEALEDIADICDGALLRYADASSGLLFSRDRARASLPPAPPPLDREVCAVRLAYSIVVWPEALTQYNS
ncbi:MAG: hypothetical protein UY40_C0020G0012 [candidate division CPR1 bacterium GW2011_GWC1_49_13]|uniref:DUF3168 domain-containing protein n=1 Tax=candidate division CPR1 bacterium GW2011_GWC1_49_13 TaxID=1618342 RepID=A0A0G1VGL3_9BACT|nr:MAG: hypothetical protein UY40_C0020G0012 [candidate division CPR1 bacterium GW2011_GWC1_49_13]